MPPRRKKVAPADLLEKIEASDLSTVTKDNYRMKAHTLVKKLQKPLLDIVLHPETYIPEIARLYPLNTSQKAHLTFILAVFRYNPDFTCDHRKAYEKWADAFNNTHQKVMDRYETNKPTDRQAEGYVPYTDIIKKRDELEPGSTERLLLGFYTHLKPMRCDYGSVRIYEDRLPAEKEREKNYILIKGNKAMLTLSAYKTAKAYGDHVIELPEPLYEDLSLSLKKDPREWLFVDINKKSQSRNTYCAWTLRVLKKLFNKPLTVSIIRHSFINQLDMSQLSVKEKKEIAQQMGHNVQTQDVYRLIFKE